MMGLPRRCGVCNRTGADIRAQDSKLPDYKEALSAVTYHVNHVPGRKVIVCRRCVQGLVSGYAAVAAHMRAQAPKPPEDNPPLRRA